MMNIGETVHEHPKATAALVIVGVVILFLLFHGGGNSSPAGSTSNPNEVAAATDAYIANQQASAQIHGSDNALAGLTAQLGAAIQGLTIQSQTTQNANELQSGIELAKINATQQSTDLANTLSAHVQESGIAANVDMTRINMEAQTANTTLITHALTQQNTENIAAIRDINIANVNAQAQRDVYNAILTYTALHR